MIEILGTRPLSLEMFQEYEALHVRVMAMELEALAEQRRERAYPVAELKVRWDRRTQNIHLYVDTSPLPHGWVLFSHAMSVRDEMDLVCNIQFHDMVGTKNVRRGDSEDNENEYVSGIVGVDGLGVYEVVDSNWIASLATTLERSVHHYCFVFTDVIIEILAGEMVVVSGPGKLSNALRELLAG
jgi:hypothetical protein